MLWLIWLWSSGIVLLAVILVAQSRWVKQFARNMCVRCASWLTGAGGVAYTRASCAVPGSMLRVILYCLANQINRTKEFEEG
jgi:hypothetical protein